MIAPTTRLRPSLWAAILLFVLALPALSQTAAPPATTALPTPVKWIVNGYVQGRFAKTFGISSPSTFEAKRAYINLRVDVDEHISGGIMASGLPAPVSLLEAYGEYRLNPEFKGRLGLYRLPFGYETPLSSSRLITLERSQVSTAMMYRDFTFDRGVYAYYTPAGKPYNLSVGLVNGSVHSPVAASNADNNSHKNIVGRLGYDLPGGQVGASVYTGRGPSNQGMQRYGIDLNATRGSFTLQGEVIAGSGTVITDPFAPFVAYADTEARGGYATVAYRQPDSAYQPYVRFDTFDPDTDTDDNSFTRFTAGVNYHLRNNSKFTIEYQTIDNDTTAASLDGFFGVQYQVSF